VTVDDIRLMLMNFDETVAQPLREWAAGQRTYFRQQGYTDDESRAMSAALFVTVFGSNIHRTPDGG